MKLELIRFVRDHDYPTLGRLFVPGLEGPLVTIEPPWRENKAFESCIWPGLYEIRKDRYKDRYDDVRILNPPPGRSAIEIHRANRASELKGCIAPGLHIGHDEQGPFVTSSASALVRLLGAIGVLKGEEATLVIAYNLGG